jgi:hypothetical protein
MYSAVKSFSKDYIDLGTIEICNGLPPAEYISLLEPSGKIHTFIVSSCEGDGQNTVLIHAANTANAEKLSLSIKNNETKPEKKAVLTATNINFLPIEDLNNSPKTVMLNTQVGIGGVYDGYVKIQTQKGEYAIKVHAVRDK